MAGRAKSEQAVLREQQKCSEGQQKPRPVTASTSARSTSFQYRIAREQPARAADDEGSPKQCTSQVVRRQELQSRQEVQQEPGPKTAKAVLFLSWREQRAHHQRLTRCEGNSREDKEQGKLMGYRPDLPRGSR